MNRIHNHLTAKLLVALDHMPYVKATTSNPVLDGDIRQDISRTAPHQKEWGQYYENHILARPHLQFNFSQILKRHLKDSDSVILR
jgi:hypothetical protein